MRTVEPVRVFPEVPLGRVTPKVFVLVAASFHGLVTRPFVSNRRAFLPLYIY